VLGMHATPESSGLNQSPLAAETFLRQAPIRVSQLHSEEEERCTKHQPSTKARPPLQPQDRQAFPRL